MKKKKELGEEEEEEERYGDQMHQYMILNYIGQDWDNQ
jgi:hypothetical protein